MVRYSHSYSFIYLVLRRRMDRWPVLFQNKSLTGNYGFIPALALALSFPSTLDKIERIVQAIH